MVKCFIGDFMAKRNSFFARIREDRYSYLLLVGHAATDINQGALPAILPFLISEYQMGYAQAAGLILACNVVSSVVQPLFGHLGDRYSNPKLICLALLLAGGGISAMGFVSSYPALFVSAMVTGIGVALFHPEGTRLTSLVATGGKGASMSIFSTGGNVGFTIGPVMVVASYALFGMKGLVSFVIVCVVVSVIFLVLIPKLQEKVLETTRSREEMLASAPEETLPRDRWGAFGLVAVIMSVRSAVNTALNTFIPLVLVVIVGLSDSMGGLGLSLFALVGVVGSFGGGFLSDRIGRKKVVVVSAAAVFPLLVLFAYTGSIYTVFPVLCLLAIAATAPHSTLIVMGQDFLPSRLGFASGIMLGVTVSVGGIFAPLFGHIGDVYGLQATILTLAAVSAANLVLCALVPGKERMQKASGRGPSSAEPETET
jgi:FSR family fosmidomycin resistance protein-like MFS transporter